MPEPCPFDYAVIRVVPRVEREEFINAGVIVSCPAKNYLRAGVALDRARLAALDSLLDAEVVLRHLEAVALICRGGDEAGPIGRLPARARFHWLVAPRSTMIQTSAVHTGFCTDGDSVLEHLLDTLVRRNGNDEYADSSTEVGSEG
jgi:hypothetical protein